jgi:hypothetical protein
MATIRLGKRTDKRSPLIREFVPLANLEDLVFAAWDPIPDDAYTAAKKAGVLEDKHLEPIADFLRGIKPMPAVFENRYVTRINGTNVKQGKTNATSRQSSTTSASSNQAGSRRVRVVRVDGDIHRREYSTRLWSAREGDGSER